METGYGGGAENGAGKGAISGAVAELARLACLPGGARYYYIY